MELFRALAAYCEAPSAAVAAALDLPLPAAAAHAELFSFQLYPYASVYVGAEGMLGGDAADRVAGFWRTLGFPPPAEPDHLAALLGLLAALAEDPAAPARRARHALLWEHLLPWLPAWLSKLDEVAPDCHRAWGALLREALVQQAEELGPPTALSAHLRQAPRLEDPRESGGGALVASLLAPVQSGIVVTRSDLARAARTLGLGLRHGERVFILNAFIAQDAPAVLGWLGTEAARWAEIHRAAPAAWLPATREWAARADATRALLAELREEATADGGHGLRVAGS
jgi:TorA maturation chaperone TorD